MSDTKNRMDHRIEEGLASERRSRILNPNDPGVKELWDKTRTEIEAIAKPGVSIDEITERIILEALIFAYTDQLSGLPNKKGTAIEVEACAAVAKKFNIPMSIIYMDGKDFSGINKAFGHAVGDEVIKALGEAFDQGLKRSTDIKLHLREEGYADEEPNIEVGREGGDEFVGILLGTRRSGAIVVGERINQILANSIGLKSPMLRQRLGRDFEVHFGTAELNPDTDESGQAVQIRADQDLTDKRTALGETRKS